MKDIEYWSAWSASDWAQWIDENVEERRQVFSTSPDDMVAGFTREKSHARDYHGRELLELIQNADDSGIHYSGANRLLIRLTDYGLFVANTGVPFSPDGVKSLMISDNSPKQFLRTQCIGYKGLGFRSVLGWASSVIILSGKLSVGFSEELASEWLLGLRAVNPKVDIKVKQFERGGINNPISTLSVPRLCSSADDLIDKKSRELFCEGKRILERGYDTVICLLFRDSVKMKEQVQKQINSLGKEILLFLQFLEKIDIESAEKSDSLVVKREEREIIVNPQSSDPKIWKVFKKEGEIPRNLLRPEQTFNNKYEIKLAIPDEAVEVNKLFVFFPTEVRFPFPIIAHATFEVGDNRQHLIDSDVNRFIAEKLADLMAESAEKIKNLSNPWYALSIISPTREIDSMLERFDFLGLLKEHIKKYKIIPVRNNSFEVAVETKRIDGNFDILLKGELFHDLCIYVDDNSIERQLVNLGVKYIEYDDLRNRLNKLSHEIALDERVDLVYLLVKNNVIQGEPPELLIDEKNEKISSQSSIFLPPEGKTFSLPTWVPQRILNPELSSLLKTKFKVSGVRDLKFKLESFNVKEYNLNALVSAIQAETNRRCKEKPGEELFLRQEAIQAIWRLYSSSEEKAKLSDETTIILLTRNDKFDSSKNLYLGKEYVGGKVLEYLYAHIDPTLFVASPEKLGFSGISSEMEDFLCWLGVNRSPRHKKTNFNHGDFHDYAVSSLIYPAKFEEITIWNSKGLKECYISLSEVSCIDRLEEVLSSADPHALICWIATAPDVESWRLNKDIGAIFRIKQPYQQKYRQLSSQIVPSHPLWLLKNVKWLPTSGGNKLSPVKCSLARVARDLEPVIGYPAINMEHPLIKDLNLDLPAIRNALIKIGVVTNLDELPWDSFYEVLFELPKLDPEGSKAKSLYRILVEGSDSDASPLGEKHDEFMTSGKMFGKVKGVLNYYPISELFYVENITLPSNIAEQFPLLEVDKRRGASKIKKLFGVEQLTRDKIQIEIVHFEEHPVSQNFQSDIERLKPYIYALRVEADTNRANLSALKKMKIILCKSARVAVVVGGERREIDFKEGDSINIDSVFYLISEPSDYSRSFLEDEIIADALGEIVSNILKVDVNNEIARLSSCSSSKRDLLLDRLVGGSGKERMEKTKELFKTTKDKEEDFPEPSPWTPPPKTAEEETPAETQAEDSIGGGIKSDDVGDVEARDLGAPAPLASRKVVARRIQENPRAREGSHSKKRVNPDRAENLAKSFEESQGRYAEKVSHIRGLQGYGCDILSFETQEDLDSFKINNNPDLVERFIEVKGSANEKGPVSLGGNELNSAKTHRENFFVYRVYEDEKTGFFELIELSDPLNSESLAIHYEINLYHSTKSHLWEIEEREGDGSGIIQ